MRLAARELAEVDGDAAGAELVRLVAVDGEQRRRRRERGVAADLGDVGGIVPQRQGERGAADLAEDEAHAGLDLAAEVEVTAVVAARDADGERDAVEFLV